MERDVAFHLLHDWMDVPVQHGDRTETLQIPESLLAVVGAPSPVGINRPERNMCEHDDRRTAFQVPYIILQPLELVRAERAKAAGLEVHYVDEADEVRALVVNTVPAVSF